MIRNLPFSPSILILLFFIAPSVFYAGLITHFTFNFFEYDHLWKAYNSLALSILDGRLDVPYEAIGRESLLYKGKVYFYYGYFPVILRLLLSPFIDLESIPLARLSVWFMTTAGAASLQYAIIFNSKPKNAVTTWNCEERIKLVMLSLIIWFGGAHFIIVQKGMIYHEPYAAMLMLASLFVIFIWRDIFWDFRSRKLRLVLYAVLAALALHTRQTVAVSLYAAVLLLVFFAIRDEISRYRQVGLTPILLFNIALKKSFYPMLILLLGGISVLLINYIRFDSFFSFSAGEYGYSRAGEGYSKRVCSGYLTGAGKFEIGRIIPNFIYYFIGGSYTHSRIIDWLGLGYVRKEFYTIRFIWLWASLIVLFLFSLWVSMRTYVSERSAREILLIAILGTFIASPLLTLSYMTITVRYIADLWLPLGFMLPVFSYIWISGEYKHGFFTNRGSIFLIGILVLANLIYAHTVYSEYKGWNIRGTVNGQPNNEILERLKNPPTLSIDKDQACARYGFKTSGILKTSDH